MDSIGRRLRKLRGDRTQIDVAKAIGIDNSVLSRMESDEKKTLDPEILIRIADFYGVSVDYVITGREFVFNNSTNTIQSELSEEKEQALKKFEKLSEKDQEFLLKIFEHLPRNP